MSRHALFTLVSFVLCSLAGLFISSVVRADTSAVTVTVIIASCSDGIDNDGDSLIDYPDDLGCSADFDDSETDVTQCSDAVDNDGDGMTDFPSDIGCDSLADDNEVNPVSGGGGGSTGSGSSGGGSSSSSSGSTGQISFAGRAYPGSSVTILKGAQVVQRIIAGSDAKFRGSLNAVTAGNHIFSLYSEDAQGNRSSLLSFPLAVTAGALTDVGGIFIAPTLATDKSQVKKGDIITFFGQTFPESSVAIEVHSDEAFYTETRADADGVYLYKFNSGVLSFGSHSAKSSASNDGEISSFGRSAVFIVGEQNVAALAGSAGPNLRADVNQDRRVNLVDFSIVVYWYKRPSPPENVDVNSDGRVDLVDLSILAYNWTG